MMMINQFVHVFVIGFLISESFQTSVDDENNGNDQLKTLTRTNKRLSGGATLIKTDLNFGQRTSRDTLVFSDLINKGEREATVKYPIIDYETPGNITCVKVIDFNKRKGLYATIEGGGLNQKNIELEILSVQPKGINALIKVYASKYA